MGEARRFAELRAWLSCVCVLVGASACASSARPAVRAPAPAAAARSPQPATARAPHAAPLLAPLVTARPELFVRCADRASCPAAIGMLVVASDPSAEPERCTVTLIGDDRVLTASHCLASSDRRAGASCAQTWVGFPETAEIPGEWIACERVLAATELIHEDGLHQEHAVLQLAHASTRAPLAIEPLPPAPGSIVTVVSVTPHPVYGSTHALSTQLCRAIDSTPAQRALGGAAANVGWLSSCPIARGNSGSPVLDYEGRIRAIVHGGTSLSTAFGVTSTVSD